MTTRSYVPAFGQPSIPEEQALEILSERLHAFEAFADRPFAEVSSEEEEWQQVTRSIVLKSFGDQSSQLHSYLNALSAGLNNVRRIAYGSRGPSQHEIALENQRRFAARVTAMRPTLRAMIKELQILSPKRKEDRLGIYDPGDPFSFYRDLTQLLRTAITKVLIVDPYFGREVFDLYLDAIPASTTVNVLTGTKPPPSAGVLSVAKLFQANRPTFSLRTNSLLHDRVIIIDDRCWAIGQSLKDAAHKKPTYLVEIESPDMRTIYHQLWAASTVVPL